MKYTTPTMENRELLVKIRTEHQPDWDFESKIVTLNLGEAYIANYNLDALQLQFEDEGLTPREARDRILRIKDLISDDQIVGLIRSRFV